jgi:hypothetical protein
MNATQQMTSTAIPAVYRDSETYPQSREREGRPLQYFEELSHLSIDFL